MMLSKESGQIYINGFDHPHVLAGQGTIGLEILEQVCKNELELSFCLQVKNVDAVLVPVGGGGLIAGVALAVKTLQPHVLVIVSRPTCSPLSSSLNQGVEAETCPSFQNAIKAGRLVGTPIGSTLADGS